MQEGLPSRADIASAIENGSLLLLVYACSRESAVALGGVLAELHNYQSFDMIDIFGRTPWADLTRQQRFLMGSLLEVFIANATDSVPRMVAFIHSVHASIGQDHSYSIVSGVEKWASANPCGCQEASNVTRNGAWDSPFLGIFLGAWREAEPEEAMLACLQLCEDDRPGMRRQAIYALSGFATTEAHLSSTALTKLAELVSATEGAARLAAIASATNMIQNTSEKPPILVQALMDATIDPDRGVRHELISGVARYPEAYPAELRGRIFDLMKTVPADWTETIGLIDLAIYNMDIARDRLLIADLLSTLVTQGGNAPTLKIFDSATYKIASLGNEMLGWFAAKWLLEGSHEVRAQVHDLFPPLDESVYDFNLASFGLSAPEILYLARKIFGYMIFSHGPATSLLWACLVSLDGTNRENLELEIAGFWLRNFPNDLEFFDALATVHSRKGLEVSIMRMRQSIEAYEKSLNSLPLNPALRPSAAERRAQAEIAHDRSKDIMRNAHKQSIFASIIAKRTILYGRASVSYFYSSPSAEPVRQVVPLIKHETSAAIPRMDALYPARFNYMLRVYRAERRPK